MTQLQARAVSHGHKSFSAGAVDTDELASADEIDVHVGRRVRERRTQLGLSQGALGRQLGLTFSQVQKYEKGVNRIGAGRLYRLAALLDVTVEYFYQDVTKKTPATSGPVESADERGLSDAFGRISDPQARQALLSLATSMVDRP